MAGAMTTTGAVPPAVPAGGKKKPPVGKKGVNPFAKKAGPVKGAPAPKGKAGPIDPKTLGSMKGSLNFK